MRRVQGRHVTTWHNRNELSPPFGRGLIPSSSSSSALRSPRRSTGLNGGSHGRLHQLDDALGWQHGAASGEGPMDSRPAWNNDHHASAGGERGTYVGEDDVVVGSPPARAAEATLLQLSEEENNEGRRRGHTTASGREEPPPPWWGGAS